jgi:Cd2+/Zn2+-exporting ATPase
MSEKKKKIIQIICSAILLTIAVIIDKNTNFALWLKLLIYCVPYLVAGFDIFEEAIEEVSEGEIFSEDFLMIIATLGALFIGFLPNSEPQFTEAVFVMLFFQVGELFEIIAEGNHNQLIQNCEQYQKLYETENSISELE